VWNYENLKLVGICFAKDADIRDIRFLEPYPLLMVLDQRNQAIHFFNTFCSESCVNFDLLISIKL
jgi:hypothetical protein